MLELDDFAKLANQMGGDERHAAALRLLSKEVTTLNARPKAIKNRDVRNAVKKLRKECDRFAAALNGLAPAILHLPVKNFEILSKARHDIEDLNSFCDQALTLNPTQHGNPKPGMLMCAVVVCEVWAAIHDGWPAHNNMKAQEACAEYWLACRCDNALHGASGKWGYHIMQARRARGSKRQLWISQAVSRTLGDGK